MKKLSVAMEDMIKGAEIHEVRVNGEIVRHGYMVAGRTNTIVALIDRGLITTSDAGNYGINWLTPAGMQVWSELTGNDLPVIRPGFRAIDPASGRFRGSEGPSISDSDAAAMWADRGISPRSLALAIEGGAVLIPDDVFASEVIASVPVGVSLAASILHGDVSVVSSADMWILDETADTVNIVAAGMAAGQMIRAWDAAHAVNASEDHPVSGMITDARIKVRDWMYMAHSVPMEAADFDRMNADAERADLEAENAREIAGEREEAMEDWHDRNSVADRFDVIEEAFHTERLMIVSDKGVIVSRAYVNTMSRIAAMNRAARAQWAMMRDIVTRTTDADFWADIDAAVAAGKVSFRNADKGKRITRQIIRPTLGARIKPSKRRR